MAHVLRLRVPPTTARAAARLQCRPELMPLSSEADGPPLPIEEVDIKPNRR